MTFRPDECEKRDRLSSKGKVREEKKKKTADLDGVDARASIRYRSLGSNYTGFGMRRRRAERASERNRERERGCVCVRICVREREISARPRLRVYSRQFGERNRKRALSRERDSGFEQIEMKEEEEREKQRKGSPVGLRSVPGKRNRAGG